MMPIRFPRVCALQFNVHRLRIVATLGSQSASAMAFSASVVPPIQILRIIGVGSESIISASGDSPGGKAPAIRASNFWTSIPGRPVKFQRPPILHQHCQIPRGSIQSGNQLRDGLLLFVGLFDLLQALAQERGIKFETIQLFLMS